MFELNNYYFHGLTNSAKIEDMAKILDVFEKIIISKSLLSKRYQNALFGIKYNKRYMNYNELDYISICSFDNVDNSIKNSYKFFVDNEVFCNIIFLIDKKIENDLLFRKGNYKKMNNEFQVFDRIPFKYIKAIAVNACPIDIEKEFKKLNIENDYFEFYKIIMEEKLAFQLEIENILKLYNVDLPIIDIKSGRILESVTESLSKRKVLTNYF